MVVGSDVDNVLLLEGIGEDDDVGATLISNRLSFRAPTLSTKFLQIVALPILCKRCVTVLLRMGGQRHGQIDKIFRGDG